MRKTALFIILMLLVQHAIAQLNFSFTHYSTDDGLLQNSITAILKDRKGFVWLGTRDGLCRFDGYGFKNITSLNKTISNISNKRILLIKEDKYGFVWFKTYDGFVYRFDVDTEAILPVPSVANDPSKIRIKDLFLMPSGVIWLTTHDDGCYKVETNVTTKAISILKLNVQNKKLNSNNVNAVFEDNDQNTWVLTSKGLNRIDNQSNQKLLYPHLCFNTFYDGNKYIVFGCDEKIIRYEKRTKLYTVYDLPANIKILKIANLSPSCFILTTNMNGFYTFEAIGAKLAHYTVSKYPTMLSNDILDVYVDRTGLAWLSLKSSAIVLFNAQNNSIQNLKSNMNVGQVTNPNFLIYEDEKDIVWVQPYLGTFSWYDRQNNRLVPFSSYFNTEINTLLKYGVNHLIADSQGILWLSTNRGNGFFKCTFLPDYFNHHMLDNASVFNISNETRAVFSDDKKRLWVATKAGVVHVFDENMREIGSLSDQGKIVKGARLGMLVYGFFQDKNRNIWLATKKHGLIKLAPTQHPTSYVFTRFVNNPSDPYSLAHNDIYSVCQDNNGRIWIGSYGGGLQMIDQSTTKVRFIHFKNELKSFPFASCSKVRQVYADSQNHIWVATTEGLLLFKSDFKNFKNIQFKYFVKNDSHQGLSSNDVHCVTEDTDGNIWIGTFGGGLNILNRKEKYAPKPVFQIIDNQNGLQSNIVNSLVDDKQGNIWLATENAIVRCNIKTKVLETFGEGNEIESVEFSESTSCVKTNDEICIGSKSGFFTFKPESVVRKVIKAPLVFTRLLVFNKEVPVDPESSLLHMQLDKMNEIKFTHKQNVFSIEFATLDMRSPDKIQYAYILEGFDKDWNNVQTKNFATYTSLPPGNYVFKVKSTDSEGVWLDNERQINIVILPSFWQSIYAKILYVILFIAFFLLTLYIFITIFKLKNNVLIEQQMTDMKLRFFTDISHELRTPLTLMALPVEKLLADSTDASLKEQLSHVKSNLDKVIVLINRILDFRKLQNNKMKLAVEEISFGEFVRNCTDNFDDLAQAKKINLTFVDESHDVKVWVDPERFESIVYNLLSNAIKFTPSGKNVTVKVVRGDKSVALHIVDEGIGIPGDKINFIFDRFFSNSTFKNLTQKSTGIGLDIVKKMVELHGASIAVDSQVGKGTTFVVDFKVGIEHFAGDVEIVVGDKVTLDEQLVVLPDESEGEQKLDDKIHPLILIVEDNDELRQFLMASLKSNYRVEAAENGVVGWSKIESLLPDIIITDLRMPEMDGVELTVKVRENNHMSHIPIILLSAVTDNDSKVQGMNAGADDYITKPFSSTFLHARIENLLNRRKQLQKYFRGIMASNKPIISLPPIEVQSQEELFMMSLMKIMDENLDNFDLNIDDLAAKMNMSRSVFFNKLKSLTGFSPVEFVRELRLQRAAEYISATQLTVSEISYRVGIDDPRYFSRCFKLKFGVTPSDYRAKHANASNLPDEAE